MGCRRAATQAPLLALLVALAQAIPGSARAASLAQQGGVQLGGPVNPDPDRTCTKDGEKCAGYPGFPAVKLVYCCNKELLCGVPLTVPEGLWGQFCVLPGEIDIPKSNGANDGVWEGGTDEPNEVIPDPDRTCTNDGKKCAGYPGMPAVERVYCCNDDLVCGIPKSVPDGLWGQFCVPLDEIDVVDSNGANDGIWDGGRPGSDNPTIVTGAAPTVAPDTASTVATDATTTAGGGGGREEDKKNGINWKKVRNRRKDLNVANNSFRNVP